jgi:hypothetical protein
MGRVLAVEEVMEGNAKERAKAIALPDAAYKRMIAEAPECRKLQHYWFYMQQNPNARMFRESDLCIIAGYAFTKMTVILKGSKQQLTQLLMDGKNIRYRIAMQMVWERHLSEISEGESNA